MAYIDQGRAANTIFRWLGNSKVKMLHDDPRKMQEASVVSMHIQELYEHARTFMQRQEWCGLVSRIAPSSRKHLQVYAQGRQLRCPQCIVWTSWTMHKLTTHMKPCKLDEKLCDHRLSSAMCCLNVAHYQSTMVHANNVARPLDEEPDISCQGRPSTPRGRRNQKHP